MRGRVGGGHWPKSSSPPPFLQVGWVQSHRGDDWVETGGVEDMLTALEWGGARCLRICEFEPAGHFFQPSHILPPFEACPGSFWRARYLPSEVQHNSIAIINPRRRRLSSRLATDLQVGVCGHLCGRQQGVRGAGGAVAHRPPRELGATRRPAQWRVEAAQEAPLCPAPGTTKVPAGAVGTATTCERGLGLADDASHHVFFFSCCRMGKGGDAAPRRRGTGGMKRSKSVLERLQGLADGLQQRERLQVRPCPRTRFDGWRAEQRCSRPGPTSLEPPVCLVDDAAHEDRPAGAQVHLVQAPEG